MNKLRSLSLVSPLYNSPRQFSAVMLLLVLLAFIGQYTDNRFVNPFMPSLSAFSVLCLFTPWIAQYIYKTFLSLEDVIGAITESSQRELFTQYKQFVFGINKWSIIVIITIIILAEVTNAIIWGVWFSFVGTTFYILLGVLFGILGSLGWAYWGILLFAFRLGSLKFDLEPFETKKDEFDKLSSCFLNIFIAGMALYIGAIVAGWLALGPSVLSIPALKFWIFPLAIIVIAFLVVIQFSLRNLMKKAKNIRINKVMLLIRKYFREWEQTQLPDKISPINDLLAWKEKIDKESDTPFDFITILSLVATIILPITKSIIELF